jgi:hypothetical protein
LTSLQKLKLSENRLERIESGAFAPLPVAGTLRVELADNPLHCDCALAWILDWAEVALARARCAQPASLQGLLVSYVDSCRAFFKSIATGPVTLKVSGSGYALIF